MTPWTGLSGAANSVLGSCVSGAFWWPALFPRCWIPVSLSSLVISMSRFRVLFWLRAVTSCLWPERVGKTLARSSCSSSDLFTALCVPSYALNSYRDSSNEIFIMNMAFKNFIYYALTNFVSSWATNQGPGEVMSVFGRMGFFLVHLCYRLLILVCFYLYLWPIFDKRLRSFWTRHLLVKWHLNSTNAPEMLA
jgi:hypothetical protein